MAMSMVDPALWNQTIPGSAHPLPVPKGSSFVDRRPHYTGYAGDVDPRIEARDRGANLARAAGVGFGGGGASAAPPTGFSVPGAPGGNPDFTPTRTSPGGSMVLGKDNLGVEEIRGTGRPSWQVFQQAGEGALYPAATAGWRSGLAREAGETTRANLTQAGETERARIQAETTKASRPDITFAVEQAKAALPEQEAKKHTEAFDKWLKEESPYLNYDASSGKLDFKPKDEGMARDRVAAMNVAGTQGVDAAKKLFAERQEVRKWLLTQPLNPNADIETWLNAGQANPEHWARLLAQVRTAAAAPPSAASTFGEPEKVYTGQSPFSVGG